MFLAEVHDFDLLQGNIFRYIIKALILLCIFDNCWLREDVAADEDGFEIRECEDLRNDMVSIRGGNFMRHLLRQAYLHHSPLRKSAEPCFNDAFIFRFKQSIFFHRVILDRCLTCGSRRLAINIVVVERSSTTVASGVGTRLVQLLSSGAQSRAGYDRERVLQVLEDGCTVWGLNPWMRKLHSGSYCHERTSSGHSRGSSLPLLSMNIKGTVSSRSTRM